MYGSTTIHPSLPPLRLHSRRSQEYAGACPYCGGDARSDRLRVWLEPGKEHFWCRQCNEKGPLAKLLGDDPRPIIHEARSRPRGRQLPHQPIPEHIPHYRELYATVALWAHANLYEAFNPEPLAYLKGRGLDDASIHRGLLGVTRSDPQTLVGYLQTEHPQLLPYAEEAGVLVRDDDGNLRTHWNLCGSLVLPYIADGEVVDLRTRSYPGKGYKSLPGGYAERGALFPFGWDDLGSATTVLLTEGEFKALAITQGYRAGQLDMPALAHPGLSYMREDWAEQLRVYGITSVVLGYDTQPRPVKNGVTQLAPEEIWSIRHGQVLAAAGLNVRVLRLPLAPGETKADLDEYLLKLGPTALQRLLDAAPSLLDYHRSLPCALLRQANLPLPSSLQRRARPRRLDAAPPVPTPTPQPTPIETSVPSCLRGDLLRARAAIPELVRQHATAGQGFLVLGHQPGVGKGFGTTQGLRTALRDAEAFGQIVWTAPRKEQLHDQQGLDFIPLHGRNPDNCRKCAEAQVLAAKGYSVREALCMRRCPFLNHCAYLRQFGQEADFFAAQPLLLAPHWWAEAGVVVLDEFDLSRLARNVAVSLSDLVAMSRGTSCPHAQGILRWLGAVVGQCLDHSLSGTLLLTALDQAAQQEGLRFGDTLRLAIDALPPPEIQALLPGFPSQATLADYQQLPPGHLSSILTQLAKEDRTRLGGQPFTSRLETRQGMLHLYQRHEHLIAQLARPEQPTIILDATLSLPLLQALFPKTPIQLERPQIPIPARVTQVISRDWAKSTLRGSQQATRRERWIESIAQHVRPDRPTLVVCTLEYEQELRQALQARNLTTVTVAHYGAVRGSNAYRGHDVILAQVYHPNLDAVIREGRALFADDEAPLDERTILSTRRLTDTSGATWEVEVMTFADARLAALLELRREAELTQAALRGRPFDHPEAQITLLFGLPLADLPPTAVVEDAASPASNAGRQEATRAQLIATAEQLLDGGQRVLTVAALAKAAGVSVTTVRVHWQAIAHALKLRPTFRRQRRAMPKGGARWYRAEVLVRRGRRVPRGGHHGGTEARREHPDSAGEQAVRAGSPAGGEMMDQAADHDPIPGLINHRPAASRHPWRSRGRRGQASRRRWRVVRRAVWCSRRE